MARPEDQKEHNEPVWMQLLHVDEVGAAIYFLLAKPIKNNVKNNASLAKRHHPENLAFCDKILGSVARPYAAAIRQLPAGVAVNVMILHHALRALDTIEDDMTAFASNEIKISYLKNFVGTALTDPMWSLDGVGEGDEALMLEQFPKLHDVYKDLSPAVQEVIKDITHRMAVGMSEFITRYNFQGPTSLEEYDEYCHYVAGLVAEGLIRLFALSGLEEPSFGKEIVLADHVGFFLQKVNIIRDFLEDYKEGRVFWPESVWSKYSKTGSLDYFAQEDLENPEFCERALQCLNEMVTNALQEVPYVLTFLGKMKCVETYRFFALLQMGAMATLYECYNNPNLFTGKVRIRKGLACQMALSGHKPEAVQEVFFTFAEKIKQTAMTERTRGVQDPSFARTVQVCDKICDLTLPTRNRRQAARQVQWRFVASQGLSILLCAYLVQHHWDLLPSSMDQMQGQETPLETLIFTMAMVTVVATLGLHVIWPVEQGGGGPQYLRKASDFKIHELSQMHA